MFLGWNVLEGQVVSELKKLCKDVVFSQVAEKCARSGSLCSEGSVCGSGTVMHLFYSCFCAARPVWRGPGVKEDWGGALSSRDGV